MTRAQLDKAPQDVASMFDTVAEKYDLTNSVLTVGIDRMWRRATYRAVDAVPGQVVLDIAAGTGTSSEPFADAGVHVVEPHPEPSQRGPHQARVARVQDAAQHAGAVAECRQHVPPRGGRLRPRDEHRPPHGAGRTRRDPGRHESAPSMLFRAAFA